MSTESDTNNPTTTPSQTPAPLVFDIEELGKKDRRWRLELRPGDLALFEGADLNPYIFLREQFFKEVFLVEHMRAISLKKPKKVTFQLTREATKAVADWLGKPLLASNYLKNRYAWILPVAILWLIGSLPLSGDPQAGIQALPFDPVGLGLGLALVVAWAFAKWRPHSTLFLVDSIWFLCLAGYLTYDVLHGRSKLWVIFIVLCLWLAITGFKHFARFRGTRITPARTS